ncbi:MAG: aminoacyl-tRNA hydrolase, partial [Burkholderiales bacterium]
LKDIIARLGPEFWRLRLGIGHPGQRDQVVDYVLRRPPREEAEQIGDAIARSLKILPLVLAGDLETAMHRLHTRVVPKLQS